MCLDVLIYRCKQRKLNTKEVITMAEKFNIYQEITNRIITQLEQGYIPWVKPWTGVSDGAFNRITTKPYSLLNVYLQNIL